MHKFTFIRCLIWNAALIVLFSFQTGYCQTDIPAGDVSGTWSLSNSPYQVNGDITIPDGQTLTIEPGVTAVFKEACRLNVQGRLIAIGTSEDTITFTAEDPSAGWHAIKFIETPTSNDTSKIVFCKIEYGKLDQGDWQDRCGGAIFSSYFSKIIISNCLLQNNRVYNTGDTHSGSGAAICLDHASPIISNNCIINNESFYHIGGGIACNYAHPIISNNVIAKNKADFGAGLGIYYSSHPILTNNLIVENQARQYGGGLRCYTSGNPVLINNTIALNTAQSSGGGVSCTVNSDPVFINTILYGNTAGPGNQVHLVDTYSDPDFYYCNIEGGLESIGGDGAGSEYSGAYENNLDTDPRFINNDLENFNLSDSSLCIGAGIDSVEIGGVWYYCPETDYLGNPRPNPIDPYVDIGALESLFEKVSGIEDWKDKLPVTFVLEQNYPNPFNPATTIEFYLPKTSNMTLKIYNILGKEVATLVSDRLSTGSYKYEWNAGNMASGIYLYRLEAGDYVETRKMVVMR